MQDRPEENAPQIGEVLARESAAKPSFPGAVIDDLIVGHVTDRSRVAV